MVRKFYTQETLIQKFNEVHGEGTYDYSKVIYTNYNNKVEVVCPKHQISWFVNPSDHISGRGCRLCGFERMASQYRETLDSFIERAKTKHGDKFDYSKVEYSNARTPVVIRCLKHDTDFEQQPFVHLKAKHACPICEQENKPKRKTDKTTESYVAEAKAKHGDKYSYGKVEYVSGLTPITVTCKTHGDFEIAPSYHLRGKGGCKKCGVASKTKLQSLSQDEYIAKAKSVHGESTYDYSKVSYRNNRDKIEIGCTLHGPFYQRASKHLEGCGCPDCAKTGFSVSKNATLYVLRSPDLIKIGITNLPIRVRKTTISNESGRSFEVVKLFDFEKGQLCTDIETILLRELRSQYRSPLDKFDGYTECFYDVNLAALLNRIEELILENKKE